mmetsp:Transcript_6910/g.17867  ORF Transcript_6910/g.17867 Transcript_6910/m.17867 type:complete len:304 (-) Transcript_6910:12-923(-)
MSCTCAAFSSTFPSSRLYISSSRDPSMVAFRALVSALSHSSRTMLQNMRLASRMNEESMAIACWMGWHGPMQASLRNWKMAPINRGSCGSLFATALINPCCILASSATHSEIKSCFTSLRHWSFIRSCMSCMCPSHSWASIEMVAVAKATGSCAVFSRMALCSSNSSSFSSACSAASASPATASSSSFACCLSHTEQRCSPPSTCVNQASESSWSSVSSVYTSSWMMRLPPCRSTSSSWMASSCTLSLELVISATAQCVSPSALYFFCTHLSRRPSCGASSPASPALHAACRYLMSVPCPSSR